MNNERYNQIINEVYSIFLSEATSIKEGYECGDILGSQPHIEEMFSNPDKLIILTQEEFINKCKTDQEFSERWGLKIEERELSLDERRTMANYESKFISPITVEYWDRINIPTKLITLEYNGEKIEVYE